MLGDSTVSLKAEDFERKLYAVVIAFGKAHDGGHTSMVNCLKISLKEAGGIRVSGSPFRLVNRSGFYIWKNDELEEKKIHEGSIVESDTFCDYENRKRLRFLSNSGQRMAVSEVLRQLSFGGGDQLAVAYRGISEAFPDAKIAPNGIYQEWARPCPPYAFISVKAATIHYDRILAITRRGEKINLNNRSLGEHKPCTIRGDAKELPVRMPGCESDIGSVILVTFGEKPILNKFQAVCEAILLQESSSSSSAETFDVTHYPMTRWPRGICLIINNLCFQNEADHRFGAENDEEALHTLFQGVLHFDVHPKNDLANYEMQRVCEEFAAKDHSEYSAFVCIIMSHGNRDHIEGVNGKNIALETLMSDFKAGSCPSLAGKPKLFIIQACRGTMRDNMMLSSSGSADSTMGGFGTDSTLCRSTCPQESDFLLAFCMAPGYIAQRERECGSVFIQTLAEVFTKCHNSEHVLDMLTIVTRVVADKGSQVPSPVTTLRYKWYL
ncbi:caspase-8-like [Montipora capricornis]|uniref:caspase-8-like n=1 Tax=Montipora capricornis TaxID=246305 RepID=UPI0035F15730